MLILRLLKVVLVILMKLGNAAGLQHLLKGDRLPTLLTLRDIMNFTGRRFSVLGI